MEQSDSLAYGYVITKLDNGDWWHGHVVRSDLEYECGLLDRRTNLSFQVQRFGRGAFPHSGPFYLTLDAEGVSGTLAPVNADGDWGDQAGDKHLQSEASRIQQQIVPLLVNSERFQQALASIVANQQYSEVGAPQRFSRVTGDPPPAAPP